MDSDEEDDALTSPEAQLAAMKRALDEARENEVSGIAEVFFFFSLVLIGIETGMWLMLQYSVHCKVSITYLSDA